mgnify:CR=1 FL=1
MKILVTGANGFIGQAFTRRLGTQSNVSLIGIVRGDVHGLEAACQIVKADLSVRGWTEVVPQGVDTVVHLAQSRRYRDFPNGASDMVALNVDATFELVQWASQHRVKRFIFASTGNVYAASRDFLVEESHCEPASMYAVTKLCGESLVRQYASHLEVVIVRLFGVYGPNQRGMLISNLIEQVEKKEEVCLAQGVGLYLTPLYIDDCVDMLCRLVTEGPLGSVIYNLSGSEELSLAQIVSGIGSVMMQQPRLKNIEGEPLYLLGSNKKFARDFGFSPRIAFEDGIDRTVRARHFVSG